jgi:predicted secreted Zn-dependent protease
MALALLIPAISQAEWQAVEKTQSYSISGRSGPELYASIGKRGPTVSGEMRAIAHTSFKLTWTRKYETRGTNCVLATARPKLIITYALPKPSSDLPSPTRENWQKFITGVQAHERVHGDFIKEMVGEIEKATIALTIPDDPGCTKIRTEMTRLLTEISQAQRQRSVDFDRVELTKGGNIHQLILDLVNGG